MQEFDSEHTFIVQVSENEEYIIDGKLRPVLYLKLGHEYKFEIQAKGFPFLIGRSALGGKNVEGVEEGRLIFKCDQDVMSNDHYYQCATRKEMGYKIIVVRN